VPKREKRQRARSTIVSSSGCSVVAGSSKKTIRPNSKPSPSNRLASAEPKDTADAKSKINVQTPSSERTDTLSSERSNIRPSSPIAILRDDSSQYSNVDSSRHFRNNDSASPRSVLTVGRLPKDFVSGIIRAIRAGDNRC
jgi:hypothetical protein